MRKALVVTAIFAGALPILVQAQAAPSDTTGSGAATAPQATVKRHSTSAKSSSDAVPPQAAVITLDGVCDPPRTDKSAACKTVVTREQLESLVKDTMPGASDETSRQFATTYARILAASAEAQQKRLDKDPQVAKTLQLKMKLLRMQVLADALYQSFEQQANQIPDADIQKYYSDHGSRYEVASLERVSIPKAARSASGVTVEPAQSKAKIDDLHTRAAAGEDFAQLQANAYKDLGLNPAGAPATKLDNVRRATLNANEQKIVDMKPGEISDVRETPDAFYFLKLVSTGKEPLESVTPEIKAMLRQQRMEKELQGASEKVKAEFNLTYLGTPSAPQLFPAPEPKQPTAANSKQEEARWRAARHRRPMMQPGQSGPSAPALPATPPGR